MKNRQIRLINDIVDSGKVMHDTGHLNRISESCSLSSSNKSRTCISPMQDFNSIETMSNSDIDLNTFLDNGWSVKNLGILIVISFLVFLK